MSHNAYIRPSGVWNTGIVVLHGEFAAFDLAQFQSINGDLGGTWAPSSVITIGGSGLTVTGLFNATSFSHFSANVQIDNGLGVQGGQSFEGGQLTDTLLVSGHTQLGTTAADTLTVNADATFAHLSTFTGTATFNGAINANNVAVTVLAATSITTGSLVATAPSAFVSTLDVQNTLSVSGGAAVTTPMTCSATGRMARPPALGAASGGGTFDVRVASVYFFQVGMSAQTYALGTTGVLNGDTLEIAMELGEAAVLTVTGGIGGGFTMKRFTTGDVWGVKLVYFSALSSWVAISWSVL